MGSHIKDDEQKVDSHHEDLALDIKIPFDPEHRRVVEKRLKLKLDLRNSLLVVIYILNCKSERSTSKRSQGWAPTVYWLISRTECFFTDIDRNNASQARLAGFEKDLGLVGSQFATLLSILYVGYILFQVPSNMIINKVSKSKQPSPSLNGFLLMPMLIPRGFPFHCQIDYPQIYIGVAMLIWGAISALTGITTNFVGALLCRFFLGFVEAVFLPGALFLLSKVRAFLSRINQLTRHT